MNTMEPFSQHNTTMASDLNKTVIEQAQEYTIYTIAMWISKYYIPIIVPIGLVGNILSFLVSCNTLLFSNILILIAPYIILNALSSLQLLLLPKGVDMYIFECRNCLSIVIKTSQVSITQ